MEKNIIFKCVSDRSENIPEEVIKSLGIKFPDVHKDASSMAALSKGIKDYRKDAICRVPFCSTVEAESLGSEVKFGNDKLGPRVSKYAITSIEDLQFINKIDLSKGRINEVLNAVANLKKQGQIVCLAVEGPFTVVTSLMESKLFYRILRKERKKAEELLEVVEDSIVDYIIEGVKRGADIISYADPVGTIDIVGPKMYEEVSGNITHNILKRVQNNTGSSIIHLCGKTSTSLESIGLVKVKALNIEQGITYGNAIKQLIMEQENIKLLGHWCIKRSFAKKSDNILWSIELK